MAQAIDQTYADETNVTVTTSGSATTFVFDGWSYYDSAYSISGTVTLTDRRPTGDLEYRGVVSLIGGDVSSRSIDVGVDDSTLSGTLAADGTSYEVVDIVPTAEES